MPRPQRSHFSPTLIALPLSQHTKLPIKMISTLFFFTLTALSSSPSVAYVAPLRTKHYGGARSNSFQLPRMVSTFAPQKVTTTYLPPFKGTIDRIRRIPSLLRKEPSLLRKEVAIESSRVPSLLKLVTFCAGPAAIWLSEPLLSLVDTTVVGVGGTLNQLAAMGPATTLMDLSLYATYFLALATTSQLTQAQAEGDWRSCQRITSQVTGVGLLTALFLTGFLFTTAPGILTSMVAGGATSQSTEIARLASRYCMIRGSVAIASILGMVGQSVCLSTQDIRTPIIAVAVASVTNVVFDYLALRRLPSHLLLSGVASATALSTVAATAVLAVSVVRKMKSWRKLEREEHATASHQFEESVAEPQFALAYTDDVSSAAMPSLFTEQDEPTTTLEPRKRETTALPSIAQEKVSEPPTVPYVSLPDRGSFLSLLRLSFPLAISMWAKYGCYFALTVRSAAFGSAALAANNVLMRVFFFVGCFGDCIGQVAQTFLPATLYPVEHKKDFHALLRKIGILAAGVSIANFAATLGVLRYGARFVVQEASILSSLHATSMSAASCLALAPIVVAISGTVIATRSFANLIKVYLVTVAVHLAVLKRATSFAQIWQAMVVFQLVRLSNYLFWSKITPKTVDA